jgi:hypothetical protein
MKINADGIDRNATETEIAEINLIKETAYDEVSARKERDKAKQAVADKLGITIDEIRALLS